MLTIRPVYQLVSWAKSRLHGQTEILQPLTRICSAEGSVGLDIFRMFGVLLETAIVIAPFEEPFLVGIAAIFAHVDGTEEEVGSRLLVATSTEVDRS